MKDDFELEYAMSQIFSKKTKRTIPEEAERRKIEQDRA